MKSILIYWQALDKREQNLALIAIVGLIICIFYFAIVSPLQARDELARRDLKTEQALFAFISDKAGEIEILREQTGGSNQVSALPINQAVTTSIKSYGLEIDRLQPQQEELDVWLKPMAFNALLKWLDHLSNKYNVQVKFIDIDETDTQGMVAVKRLRLGRG